MKTQSAPRAVPAAGPVARESRTPPRASAFDPACRSATRGGDAAARDQRAARDGRERDRGRVHADTGKARHAVAGQGRKALEHAPRERDSGKGGRRGEHRTLGQHLSHEPPAAGANRGSKRHFVLSHARTREQEVGGVQTRDQEHEQHRAGDDDNRLTDVPHHVFEERCQRHLLAGVGRRIRRRHRRGQRLRFLARAVEGRSPRAAAPPPTAIRWRDRPAPRAPGQRASRDRHAGSDTRTRRGITPTMTAGGAVERDRASEDCRIAAEAPLPEPVAQHDDRRRALTIVGIGVDASDRGRAAEHGEEVAGRDDRAQPQRLPIAGQVVRPVGVCGHALEGADPRAVVQPVRRRERTPAAVLIELAQRPRAGRRRRRAAAAAARRRRH